MAIVPTVPRAQRTVEPTPLPNVQREVSAPSQAFGGAPLPDLSPVVTAAQRIAEEARQQANEHRYLQADRDLFTLRQQVAGPILQAQGTNAMAAADGYERRWQEGADAILNSTSNPEQRAAVERRIEAHREALTSDVLQHVQHEDLNGFVGEVKAGKDNRFNDAIAHSGDPAYVQQQIAESSALTQTLAKRLGVGAEETTAQIAADTSRIHVGVIDRMLANGQDLGASDYYQRIKGQVAGSDVVAVERALEAGSSLGESQRVVDRIMSGLPPNSAAAAPSAGAPGVLAVPGTPPAPLPSAKAPPTTLADALALVRDANLAPRTRELAESRLRQVFSEQAESTRLTREQKMLDATNIIERTHDVAQVPAATWALFTESERGGMRDYAEKLSKGLPVQTDWTAYYALKREAADPQGRETFMHRPLLALKGQLAPTEFKEMTDLQARMIEGDAGAEKTLGGWRSLEEVVNGRLRDAGFRLGDRTSKDDQAAVDRFRRTVDIEVQNFEERTKKRPTPADMGAIVDDLLVQGQVAGTGLLNRNTTEPRRVFERQPGERLILSVDDVPASARQEITTALRARGMPATDRAIVHLYTQRINRLPAVSP